MRALVKSGGLGMVGKEALRLALVEGVEFGAIDGGRHGFGGETIIGMERLGKEGAQGD